jgi:hypothetical protein
MRRVTRLGGSFVFSGVLAVDLPGVFADLVRVFQSARNQVLGSLDGQELGERLVQHMRGHILLFDQELDEQGLVESASLFIVTAAVELLWFLQDFQASVNEGNTDAKVLDDSVQALRELGEGKNA